MIPFVVGIWSDVGLAHKGFFWRSYSITNVASGSVIYSGADLVGQEIPQKYNIPFYHSQIKLLDVTAFSTGLYTFDVRIEYYYIAADNSQKNSAVYTKRLRVNLTSELLPVLSGWLYGDTHAHTVFTNQRGQGSLADTETGGDVDMFRHAGQAIGLNWVTTTDHAKTTYLIQTVNYLDNTTWPNLKQAASGASDGDFVLIPGEELYLGNLTGNHMIVHGNSNYIATGTLAAELSDVTSQGAIAFAAHPYDPDFTWTDADITTALTYPAFIGLELWNTLTTRSKSFPTSDNTNVNPFEWGAPTMNWSDLATGISRWNTILVNQQNSAQPRKVFIAGGSDAHGDFSYTTTKTALSSNRYYKDNCFARVRTALYLPDGLGTGGQNVITALRNGRAVATNGPFAVMNLDLEGDGLLSGQTDNAAVGEECYCEISDLANDLSRIVVNYKNINEFGGLIDTLRLIVDNKTRKWTRSQLTYGNNSSWDEGLSLKSNLYEPNVTPAVGDKFFLQLQAFAKKDTFRCYTNPVWIKVVPDLQITTPLADRCITGSQQTIEVNSGSSDMTWYKKVEFYANEQLIFTDSQAPFSTTWNLSGLLKGANTLSIKGYDALGRVHQHSIEVIGPDNTLADGQVTPAAGGVDQTFTFSVTYTSACNLPPDDNTVTLNIDGTAYPIVLTGQDWSAGVTFSYARSSFAAGSHTCYFSAAQNGAALRWPETGTSSFTVTGTTVPWTFTVTGITALVTVRTSINPTLAGQPLQSDDVIGLFFLRDGLLVCGGYGTWTAGSDLTLTAYGDESSTPLKDGFAEDEIYQFKIWDASADLQYSAIATFESGGPNYTTGSLSVLATLTGYQSITHHLSLPLGWSMISSYSMPGDGRLETLMAGLGDKLTILKNMGGKVYWPAMEINTIGDWNFHQGYQIYMTTAAVLSIIGQAAIPESSPIPLAKGWNMIAYLRSASLDIVTALASISSDLVIVKNGAGKVYWPAMEIDAIGTMNTGEGYQIYMNQAGTLTYPANSLARGRSPGGSTLWTPQHYAVALPNSGSSAVIGIRGELLANGDEVSAWDRSGRLLAAGIVYNQRTVLVVPGDDTASPEICEGPAEGDPVFLRIWRRDDDREQAADSWLVADALTGVTLGSELAYHSNAVYLVEAGAAESALASTYRLEQNYPNPFNPETVVRFSMPQDARVRLTVLNLQGRLVRTLVDEHRAAGAWSVIWDGRDDSGQPATSGIYLIRMQAGYFGTTIKISLIK